MSHQPAGWYADPRDPTAQRWWDGEGWTTQTRPTTPPPPPPPPPSAPSAPPAPPPPAPTPSMPPVPPPPPTQPAGWYPDPRDSSAQRRWDGTAWTHDVRPVPAPDADPTAAPTPAPDAIADETQVIPTVPPMPPPVTPATPTMNHAAPPSAPDEDESTTGRLVVALLALAVVAAGLGWFGWQVLSGDDDAPALADARTATASDDASASDDPSSDPTSDAPSAPDPTPGDDRPAALADALDRARTSTPAVAVLAGTCMTPQPRLLNGLVLDPRHILVPIGGPVTSAAVVMDGEAHTGGLVALDETTSILVLATPVDHPMAPSDAGPFTDDDVLGVVAVGRTDVVTGVLTIDDVDDTRTRVTTDIDIAGAAVIDHTGRLRGMLVPTGAGLTVARTPDLTGLDDASATLTDACPSGTMAVEQRVPVEVLASDPDAEAMAATLSDYYTAINRRDVDAAFATFTAAERDGLDPTVFADQIASSVDWLATLHTIGPHPDIDDAVAVEVTFTSLQQPDLAPDGVSRCTRWHLLYAMTLEGGAWRIIGTRPAVEDAPFVPCS